MDGEQDSLNMSDATYSQGAISVREERESDIAEVFALVQGAFSDRPFSSGTEGSILQGLRADGDMALALVAERGGERVGHIAFSPVSIDGDTEGLFALGPVAARVDLRGQGIGTALIETGLGRLRECGAKGCVLVGDPGYYSRFGFEGDIGLTHNGLPPRVVQGLFWDGCARTGEIAYAPAFGR